MVRKSNPSGKSGRPHLPHRLPGHDLKSVEGRLYGRHYRAFAAEFPKAAPADLRDGDATRPGQGEAIAGENPWLRARARDDSMRLSRLMTAKRAALRGLEPVATVAEEDAAPSLAHILARHAPGKPASARKQVAAAIPAPGADDAPSARPEAAE